MVRLLQQYPLVAVVEPSPSLVLRRLTWTDGAMWPLLTVCMEVRQHVSLCSWDAGIFTSVEGSRDHLLFPYRCACGLYLANTAAIWPSAVGLAPSSQYPNACTIQHLSLGSQEADALGQN